MSDDADKESRTEEPTEKRLADARERGQLPFSRDLPAFLSGCAIWASIAILAVYGAAAIANTLRLLLEQPGEIVLRTSGDATRLTLALGLEVASALAPVLAVLTVAGIAGAVMQSHGPAMQRIKPQLSRISLAAGWKRLFGAAGLATAAKSLLKLSIIGFAAIWGLRHHAHSSQASLGIEPEALAGLVTSSSAHLTFMVLSAFLLVALIDSVMARISWTRELRMSHQEIKEETKQAEGNPLIKARLRFIARQRSRRRIMAAVPSATVVIANPSHYAVALRYVREEGGAPRVVSKGRDRIALRIRAIAEKKGIPVIEDRWLARTLHDNVPIDALIPQEFYRAVARIIHILMKRTPGGQPSRPVGREH